MSAVGYLLDVRSDATVRQTTELVLHLWDPVHARTLPLLGVHLVVLHKIFGAAFGIQLDGAGATPRDNRQGNAGKPADQVSPASQKIPLTTSEARVRTWFSTVVVQASAAARALDSDGHAPSVALAVLSGLAYVAVCVVFVFLTIIHFRIGARSVLVRSLRRLLQSCRQNLL